MSSQAKSSPYPPTPEGSPWQSSFHPRSHDSQFPSLRESLDTPWACLTPTSLHTLHSVYHMALSSSQVSPETCHCSPSPGLWLPPLKPPWDFVLFFTFMAVTLWSILHLYGGLILQVSLIQKPSVASYCSLSKSSCLLLMSGHSDSPFAQHTMLLASENLLSWSLPLHLCSFSSHPP